MNDQFTQWDTDRVKAREQLNLHHQQIMEQCHSINPIMAEYVYPHTFDIAQSATRNHKPERFIEAPYNAKTHAERMLYSQGAAFTRWQYEDAKQDLDDAHVPLMLWWRRLYETSQTYSVMERFTKDRGYYIAPVWYWEYHLATMFAASKLAPLIASWGLTFRQEIDKGKGICLMLDFELRPGESVSHPAFYAARAIVDHAHKTGELGYMPAALFKPERQPKPYNKLHYYEAVVRVLEAHGYHKHARPYYFCLRPDIRHSNESDVLVPMADADTWVNHQAARAAYEAEFLREAPEPTTVGQLYAMLQRNKTHYLREAAIAQWWWYCLWRYGFLIDWGSIVYITRNLPIDHPLHGLFRWNEQFS